jgi:hypothetical protein
MKSPPGRPALGLNSLVLPPGILQQPYDATIAVRNGSIQSVALLTQVNGGALISAIDP